MLDPNYRSKLWSAETFREVVRDLARRCDIVMPGQDEAELLTGETDPRRAAENLRALGPATVVVKIGAQGALALVGDTETRAPAYRLDRIVDPVGAGDAFAAGYFAGLLRGFSTEASLALANRCGAIAMTAPGDMESLPFWEELTLNDGSSSADVRR